MGFLDRYMKRQNVDESFHTKIDRLGMAILNDEKMMARLGVYDEMHTLMRQAGPSRPDRSLDLIEEQAYNISDALHQVAIPFGRAGDEKWYAEAMRGWSTLHTRTLDMIHSARALLERAEATGWHGSESERQELIGKVWNFFQNVYVRYALLIAEFSWYREDVTPSWSAVLTQPTQTGERGMTTFQSPRNLNEEIKGEEGSDG